MIKIPTDESYKNQKQIIINMKKSCFPVIILLNYMFAIIYLVLQHGSLPLANCFIRVLICLVFCKSNIALLVFGLVNFVDFYTRSVIYKIELEKYNALLKENGKSFI